jgi:hypothetical protein
MGCNCGGGAKLTQPANARPANATYNANPVAGSVATNPNPVPVYSQGVQVAQPVNGRKVI